MEEVGPTSDELKEEQDRRKERKLGVKAFQARTTYEIEQQ